MTLMGKGHYMWQIPKCDGGSPAAITARVVKAGVSHVMIKIADGYHWAYNIDQKTKVDWSGVVLAPGSSTDIVDLKDPGVITRFWATFGPSKQMGVDNRLCRLLVINIYWDGSQKPAVSAPLSDFFCQPLGDTATKLHPQTDEP